MDGSVGGVILYAASSSPSSPSSGYQTQSPASHSQPSSPEDVSFTDMGCLKQGCVEGESSSPKLVFQFPEVTPSSQQGCPYPVDKKPCKFTGTFSKTGGMVLLCKVCGDVASGFHYGVHACEGCKGFFRRSIQQNIHYKMCVKNESCLIIRMNRNRCQHCRFRKCLSVGMSRDAVRFGRIPKREKQRLLDEMQSYMKSLNHTPSVAPPTPGDRQPEDAVASIHNAYHNVLVNGQECPGKWSDNNSNNISTSGTYPPQILDQTQTLPLHTQRRTLYPTLGYLPATQNSVNNNPAVDNSYRDFQSSSQSTSCDYSSYATQAVCPWTLTGGMRTLACPLNACPVSPEGSSSQQVWDTFSQSFTPVVREVVEFAKSIPGFLSLRQQDQVMLLKAGTFQVLMVRFCSLFNAKERTVTFLNGQTYPLPILHSLGMGPLLDAMFDFSEKLGSMELEEDETALFMAVVLVSADLSGDTDVTALEQLRGKLIQALQTLISRRHPENSELFSNLLVLLSDLQTLNNMHCNKLLSFHIQP